MRSMSGEAGRCIAPAVVAAIALLTFSVNTHCLELSVRYVEWLTESSVHVRVLVDNPIPGDWFYRWEFSDASGIVASECAYELLYNSYDYLGAPADEDDCRNGSPPFPLGVAVQQWDNASCYKGGYMAGEGSLLIDCDCLFPAEMDLLEGGIAIADEATHDVGERALGSMSLTYTIDNTAGSGQLEVDAVTATALSNCSGFLVATVLPMTIPAGQTASLVVSLNVDSTGAFQLDMDIANNDADEGTYDVSISGVGQLPEIAVLYSGSLIPDGGALDVGTRPTGRITQTFTVDNTAGVVPLDVTDAFAANQTNCGAFAVDTSLPLRVAAGSTGELVVGFVVDSPGAFSFDMDIASNDGDEDPYDITILGTASATGDVNDDGVLDVLDVRLCLQIAFGVVQGTAAQRAAADVNGDGVVTREDAEILAQLVIGIRSTLP